jgi:hypothetical protein
MQVQALALEILVAYKLKFLLPYKAGLEKTRVFKKNSPVCFFLGFLGFLVFFGVFYPEERVFRVFSVSRILLGATIL